MKDACVIALAYDKNVRIYVANSTKLVQKATTIHQTLPTASAAFGRFLTVSVMMSLMDKNNKKFSLRILGDGPIKSLTAETHNGLIKGTIGNNLVYEVYEDGPNKGKLNVAKAVGKGTLYVIKDLGLKEPFTSSIELISGEIAEDFTYYFAASEQTPSVVSLGVSTLKNKVISAGGFILQLLPGCPDEVITIIENIMANLPSMSQMLSDGLNQFDIINILSTNSAEIIDTKPIKYYCGCSKKRFAKSLGMIAKDELINMIKEDHGCHIKCNFCQKDYYFTESELTEILLKKK